MALIEAGSKTSTAIMDCSTIASRAFFLDPNSYTSTLSRTKDGLVIVGCIEPRPLTDLEDLQTNEVATPKNIIQTPGGGAGISLDAAIEMTISSGELVTLAEGGKDERDRRTRSIFDVHEGCRFIGAIATITGLSANPDETTLDNFRRWHDFHELGLTRRQEQQLIDSNARHHEYLLTNGHEAETLEAINNCYPDHKNFKGVVGPNISRLYAVNHHPDIVLDRKKKASSVDVLIQGYHDGLGATLNTLRYNRLTPDQRLMRAGAAILRSASTKTKITDTPSMTVIDIYPSRNGVEIIEQEIT